MIKKVIASIVYILQGFLLLDMAVDDCGLNEPCDQCIASVLTLTLCT